MRYSECEPVDGTSVAAQNRDFGMSRRGGANFNLIIGSTALDPVSGTASHRAYLCDIRRIA
jgi:hypothetical protein